MYIDIMTPSTIRSTNTSIGVNLFINFSCNWTAKSGYPLLIDSRFVKGQVLVANKRIQHSKVKTARDILADSSIFVNPRNEHKNRATDN
jgi:hypothetical protein